MPVDLGITAELIIARNRVLRSRDRVYAVMSSLISVNSTTRKTRSHQEEKRNRRKKLSSKNSQER